MRRAIGVAAGVLVTIGVWIALAQAAECTGQHCVYVPLLQGSNGPTSTAGFGPIPPVLNGPCTVHEPAPVGGAQAWMSAYNLAPGDTAVLCVRLIESGQVVPNALAAATIHYPDREVSIDGQRGGSNGVTVLPFTVGAVAPGQLIMIDAVAIGHQQDWPAQVTFLSQAVPTLIPTLTPMPLATVTSTATAAPTSTSTATPTATSTATPTP